MLDSLSAFADLASGYWTAHPEHTRALSDCDDGGLTWRFGSICIPGAAQKRLNTQPSTHAQRPDFTSRTATKSTLNEAATSPEKYIKEKLN